MRPTHLEIEGFISFRERTEIDFSALDLFGITGPTGAGKTALIDSMIFALYGKTPRLGEKGTQELISQGAPQLKVLLEFDVGPVSYRVLRIVKRKGPGRTQIERKNGEVWQAIANSTRELRERVQEIVGLDFDGFTKTVVLPQGQFDRFLRGDGAARRKILSDLLGLDTYERMMRRANEIARDANRQCDVLTELAAQQFGTTTPERLLELDTEIGLVVEEQKAASCQVASLEKALPFVIQLRQTQLDFERYALERDRLRKALETAAAQVGDCRRRNALLQIELDATGYDPKRHWEVTSILPIARRQADLSRAIESLERRQQEEAQAEGKLATAASVARDAWSASVDRAAIASASAASASEAWQAFRAKHGSADLLAEAAREAANYPKIQATLATLLQEIAAVRRTVADAEAKTQALSEADAKAAEASGAGRANLDRLRLLHAAAGVRQLLAAGEPCPVCLHPVDEVPAADQSHGTLEAAALEVKRCEEVRERARAAVVENRVQLETLPKRLQADIERAGQFTHALDAVEGAVMRLTGEPASNSPAEQLQRFASRAKALEASAHHSHQESRTAAAGEAALLSVLKETETRLALVQQARANTARELNDKRLESADSPHDLTALDSEAKSLDKARQLHERLVKEQSDAERAGNKAEVDERSVSERLALTTAALAGLAERADGFRSQLEGLPLDDGLELRLGAARHALQSVEARLAERRHTRQLLETKARDAEQLNRRVLALEKEHAIHARLGTLLRTDQFVAWILKDAFARLAYEGSRQLETLSNGRYTFAAGADDFSVCDRWNAGERRSVNTLSGGEAFLASLSLALALSRGLTELAAHRDRFLLDSLFLDEGFSTLDAETLDTVLGAVEMLQADCRLIGVISHAPELAERLPGRIEVVKGANGSRVIVR